VNLQGRVVSKAEVEQGGERHGEKEVLTKVRTHVGRLRSFLCPELSCEKANRSSCTPLELSKSVTYAFAGFLDISKARHSQQK
jgi:hypothetical protein